MQSQISINATQLSFVEVIEMMGKFTGTSIHVASPFICAENTVLDYWIFNETFFNNSEELFASAKENNVTLIFQVPLSGLGTKTSQNTKVLDKYIDYEILYNQIEALPKENKKLLNKRHFVTPSTRNKFGFRVKTKQPATVMRLLNLENEEVISVHRGVLNFLAAHQIIHINIIDVSESYSAEVLGDSGLTLHRQELTNCHHWCRIGDEHYGFAINLVEESITESVNNSLQFIQKHGQVVDEVYHRENTQVSMLIINNGFIIINNSDKYEHIAKSSWPKRSFGAAIKGKYTDKYNNLTIEFDKKGNFIKEIITPVNTSQLFDKCC